MFTQITREEIEDEYNRLSQEVNSLFRYIEDYRAKNIEPYLLSSAIILLTGVAQQFYQWCLARRLGFNSYVDAQNLIKQLEFCKGTDVPFQQLGKDSGILVNYFKLPPSYINSLKSRSYCSASLNFKHLLESLVTLQDHRNALAHEGTITSWSFEDVRGNQRFLKWYMVDFFATALLLPKQGDALNDETI
ncbi:MAG: hypothetical protein ACKO34_09155 [Vampirovibrionales bacterium]